MIPSGTRFIGISPTVDLTERRSALLNKQTEPFTVDDIRGYKVYTALLTQVGDGNVLFLFSGDLTIGVTYLINDNTDGDFTNVGSPNNNVGTSFVATGTTPNSWGVNGQLAYNTGAPTVTVLENTIGNIWFEYDAIGNYLCKSDSLFTENKTTIDMDAYCQNGNPDANLTYKDLDTSTFTIGTYKVTYQDDLLSNNRLEIKIYN